MNSESPFWQNRKFKVQFTEIELRILSAMINGSTWIRDPYLHNIYRHSRYECDCIYHITLQDRLIINKKIASIE